MVNQGNATKQLLIRRVFFRKLLIPPYLPYQRLLFELHTLLQNLINGDKHLLAGNKPAGDMSNVLQNDHE